MEKLVLIDGHSILNRAFYGVPDLTNSEGIHTNAVYGFLNIMFKILEEEQCDHLAVAFDLKEPTFRHKMYGDYKGTRKPMPEELREQVPLMKEVLRSMGVLIAELEGYEADDILGTLARRGAPTTLVTGDATHVLAGRSALDLFLRSGGTLAVRRELTIAAVAANPWSAYGWHFEPEKFISALRQAINLPVVNVKEDQDGTDA